MRPAYAFVVDFNMREADGRVPARISPGFAARLNVGDPAMAADEDIVLRATVDEIASDGTYILLAIEDTQ